MGKRREKLSANMEDYLETIAVLRQEKGLVRVKDISDKMNVRKPSVTAAMILLAKKGLIVHEKYGYIELTAKGAKLANAVRERHAILKKFFIHVLGVSVRAAEIDACKIEHSLSKETFNKFTGLVEFMEAQSEEQHQSWRCKFEKYMQSRT